MTHVSEGSTSRIQTCTYVCGCKSCGPTENRETRALAQTLRFFPSWYTTKPPSIDTSLVAPRTTHLGVVVELDLLGHLVEGEGGKLLHPGDSDVRAAGLWRGCGSDRIQRSQYVRPKALIHPRSVGGPRQQKRRKAVLRARRHRLTIFGGTGADK